MTSILTSEKLQECLEARNDVAIHILSVVKDASEVFPPLRLAAEKALSIAIKVREFRESKRSWKEFGDYVKEKVGEIVLRWEICQSGSGESFESWRMNIEELHSMLAEILASVDKQMTKREHQSALQAYSLYRRDPGRIDWMKKMLDTILCKFELHTNIIEGHPLALVVKTILSKIESIRVKQSDSDRHATLKQLQFGPKSHYNSWLPGIRTQLIEDVPLVTNSAIPGFDSSSEANCPGHGGETSPDGEDVMRGSEQPATGIVERIHSTILRVDSRDKGERQAEKPDQVDMTRGSEQSATGIARRILDRYSISLFADPRRRPGRRAAERGREDKMWSSPQLAIGVAQQMLAWCSAIPSANTISKGKRPGREYVRQGSQQQAVGVARRILDGLPAIPYAGSISKGECSGHQADKLGREYVMQAPEQPAIGVAQRVLGRLQSLPYAGSISKGERSGHQADKHVMQAPEQLAIGVAQRALGGLQAIPYAGSISKGERSSHQVDKSDREYMMQAPEQLAIGVAQQILGGLQAIPYAGSISKGEGSGHQVDKPDREYMMQAPEQLAIGVAQRILGRLPAIPYAGSISKGEHSGHQADKSDREYMALGPEQRAITQRTLGWSSVIPDAISSLKVQRPASAKSTRRFLGFKRPP